MSKQYPIWGSSAEVSIISINTGKLHGNYGVSWYKTQRIIRNVHSIIYMNNIFISNYENTNSIHPVLYLELYSWK